MTEPKSAIVQLKAADGHSFDAYRAAPRGKPRGGIVVVQEIFGLTSHIEHVARQYAEAGYVALAPALFDRASRKAVFAYTEGAAGMAIVEQLKREQTLLDVRASIDALATAGKVGLVGYCWGGALAYLAACHLPLSAAVAYYGAGLTKLLERTPKCPVMFHFGEQDTHIPAGDIEKVKKAYPLGHYYLYPAGHGFNCTDRDAYDAPSAKLALQRSLDFLHRHVG
jgi:carboxymethylenebutenolidase